MTDLSSTNGTYINDEELVPLRAVEMSVGTEVTFGITVLAKAKHFNFQNTWRRLTCLFAGDMFLAKFRLEERN